MSGAFFHQTFHDHLNFLSFSLRGYGKSFGFIFERLLSLNQDECGFADLSLHIYEHFSFLFGVKGKSFFCTWKKSLFKNSIFDKEAFFFSLRKLTWID